MIIKMQACIQGTRPLLAISSTGAAGNDPEDNDPEGWRNTTLVGVDGNLYLEPTYIFGCLRNASVYTLKGASSYQKELGSLQVVDPIIWLNDLYMPGWSAKRGEKEEFDIATADTPSTDSSAPVYLDIRCVVNLSDRSWNIRYRVAASAGWKLNFTIQWDEKMLNRAIMKSILRDAGNLVGLGDGRPEFFGRFKVLSFEEVE